MATLPKTIYRFNVSPIKIPLTFFRELVQIILKSTCNHKRQNCQSNSEEKEKSWKYNSFRPQTILQSDSNQNSIVLAQKQAHRSVKQNKKPRSKLTHLLSINLQQRRQSVQWRKDSLFNTWDWESWTATYKSMKLGQSFILYTKINSKWFKDQNIRHDTVKFLEENIDNTFLDINHINIFLGQPPKAKYLKINKWDQIKLKIFCT